MARKPTYEELQRKVEEYERESAKRIEMEEALRESEERLKFVIEGSQQGFWDWNIETGIVQRNERCAAMLGYTPEEFKNTIRQWRDLIHPDDRAATKESMYDHIRGRSPRHEIEYRMLTKDGSYKWVLDQATIVKRDSQGRALRVCGTHTDITERKQVKERLQAQLANAVEMAHLGPWEYEVATDLFTFNDHFYKIFRTTAGKVGGYTMSSAEYARRFVHPDDLTVVAKEIRKSIEATDPNFSQSLEHRMLYADGTVGYISVRIFILKDKHGKTINTYGVNQDITERKRAEEALRRSEEKYKELYEDAPVGYMEFDTEGGITRVNRRGLQMLGYSAEEMIGEPAWNFVLEKEKGRALIKAKLAGESPPSKNLERTYVRKDGTTFPGLIEDVVFKDKAGRIIGIRSTIQDITELKRAEAELRKAEKRYRDLYDEAPVGYHELDSDGRIVRVNRRELEMLGYTTHEMMGNHIWDFVVEREESERAIREKLAGIRQPSKGLERTYTRKDETALTVSIDDVLLKDEKGRIIGIRSALSDITERKRAENALVASEKRFRALYQGSPTPTVTWQKQGDDFALVDCNKAAEVITGWRVLTLLGRKARELYAEKQEALNDLFRCHDKGEFTRTETISELFLPGRLVVFTSAFVPPDLVLVHLEDITERRRAEEEKEKLQAQLIQAQKMESIGRLAGGVAHDFNNMLGIIIGNVDLAALQVDPAEPVHQRLQEILKASRRSAETVKQLLAFARRQTISPKVLDLNDTVSGMLNMLQPLIGENIDLSWNPAHGLWPVKIDPSQVSQILANLAVNARDAIAGVGKITIETKNVELDETYCVHHRGFHQGKYTMLAVSDTGTGMSKEVLQHLFEPFFTTKDVGKGTGLGLSTVYGIVKQNNGFINAYSEPGQGTTFKVYLPQVESKSSEYEVERVLEKLPRGTETVLIVEDEEAILSVGKAMLEQLGYKVLTATSPGDAIQIADGQGRTIQLLLTDVVMPEMSGRELADHLKAICPGLKCLYMSGYTANVIAHQGILEEGIAFIQKPFSTMEIGVKVRELLDKD